MRKGHEKKNTPVRVLLLVLCAVLCLSLVNAGASVQKQNSTVIRVGSFPYEGFLDAGETGGYAFDYLQEISQFTGWQYEFVNAPWSECLDMLAKGEIDLMGVVMKSPEREQVYGFSSMSMLSGYGVLVTRQENERLPYEDFVAFDGLRVGVLRGNRQMDSFLDYARKNQFLPQVIEYDSQDQMDAALYAGGIDAMIMTNVLRSSELRVVAKFGENDGYFVTNKGNTQILEELDHAMEQIQFRNPYYNKELNQKYFDLQAVTPISFTREELEFLKNSGPIRCVYNPAARPISYDSNGGSFEGIAADVCDLLESKTGITFDFIHPVSSSHAMELFEKNQAQLLVGAPHDFSWAQKHSAFLTNAFLDGQTVMVTSGELPENPRIAQYDQFYAKDLVEDLLLRGGGQELYYSTITDCLDAIRGGDADVTYVNSVIMSYYANNPKYDRMRVTQVYGSSSNSCIAVSNEVNPILVSILDKVLSNISDTKMNQIVSSNMKAEYLGSFMSLLYARPLDFLLLFGGVLLLVAIILLVMLRNRARSNNAMMTMLYVDSLTGYPNYKSLTEAAPKLLGAQPQEYAVLYMDMRQFKYINDSFGYAVGDHILCSISDILHDFIEKDERFARVYADKFVLLLRCAHTEQFHERLGELSRRLGGLAEGELTNISFVFSCGIFQLQPDASNIDMACDRANYAKDTAQNVFSNTFVFYDDVMRTQILSEKALESGMRRALEQGEFVPYYQPKVNAVTDEVVGAEALVRWNHPEKGVLSPGVFMPFFEKNGFVVNVDFAVLEKVCRDMRAWLDSGRMAVPASVNFSRRHMVDPHFVRRLLEITDRYQIPCSLLEIEITETVALDDLDKAVEFAQALKDCGFLISIDDYGTGYSSIAFLQKLPLDVLKLDKSFIENAMQSKKAQDIMRHLVSAVRDNQIRVLCEGIETQEQRDFIISQNCCIVQGYFYAKPLERTEFEEYLSNAKLSVEEFLEFIPTANLEEHLRAGAEDFFDRIMPGWVLSCWVEEGYPILYVSPEMVSALGYSEPEFMHVTGGCFLNCLYEQDRGHVERELYDNRDNTKEYLLQYRLKKKDGGYLWIRDMGKRMITEDGRQAMLCVCTDISDIVALQNQKDDLIRAIPGGVGELLLTPDGPVIQSATQEFYGLLGYTEQEMAGYKNRLFSVVHEVDLPGIMASLRHAVETNSSACECTLRVRHADGSLHWINLRGTIRETGAGREVTVIGHSIDGQVQAEQEAEIVRIKMEMALTLTDHAVFEYDIQSKCIYEQNGLERYCTPGMSFENMPQSAVDSGYVYPADADAFLQMYRKVASGEAHASCEMRICGLGKKGDPPIWVRTTLSTIFNEDATPVKAVGIMENIDRAKRYEQAFEQEGQYRRVMMQTAILSYDINLTRDKTGKIFGVNGQRLKRIRQNLKNPESYTQLLENAVQHMLIPEDRERFMEDMNLQNLLRLVEQGVTEKEWEYQRLMLDGSHFWVSASVFMAPDLASGDMMCFVYYRDIHERKSMEENWRYRAARDPLTGLLNRTAGKMQIQEFFSQEEANTGCHAFMMLDVDHFKQINDTYGHQRGDEVLIHMARSLLGSLRSSDLVVRMGGDEFAVLVRNLPGEEMAMTLAQKITQEIRSDCMLGARDTAQVSIGIAMAPRQGTDFETLYRCADSAMYRAKKDEKTHIVVYEGE